MKGGWENASSFIRRIKTRLPVGTRVKMSPEAARMFPRYKGVLGTIVGHKFGSSATVLWDGRRTADSYAPWFIHRAKAPTHD